ncbi:hypothetical protein [Blautia sp. NSJ-166]|nr:hypothetical protein [Blautia sp. NSJ-166]
MELIKIGIIETAPVPRETIRESSPATNSVFSMVYSEFDNKI